MESFIARIYSQKINEIQTRIPVKISAGDKKEAFEQILSEKLKAGGQLIGTDTGPVQQTDFQKNEGWNTGAYEGIIENAARKYGVSAQIIRAVIKAESDFNPRAVSSAGAMGLMQLMPVNVREAGVTDPFDPVQNIDAGTRQLGQLLDRYGGDLKMALAAYNCGPGTLARQGITNLDSEEQMTKLYSETRIYVKKIMRLLNLG